MQLVNITTENESQTLFRQDSAIQVPHGFTGLTANQTEPSHAGHGVEGIIGAAAKINALFVTMVSCLTSGDSEEVGRHK